MLAASGTNTAANSRIMAAYALRAGRPAALSACTAQPSEAKTTMPPRTGAKRFDANSFSAPGVSHCDSCPRHTPATSKGGRRERAIVLPGSTAATSRRASATAPAKPVARAVIRSIRPGDVRDELWLLDGGS